jgi:hypothetical protein
VLSTSCERMEMMAEPLTPEVKRPHRYPGRKWIDDRKVFTGILFVLKINRLGGSAVGLGCGSWMTCWQRLRGGRGSGSAFTSVARQVARVDQIDWSRVVITLRSGAGCFGLLNWP